jgi:2-polyprenyl-3-methyl-5-hydroxy-6-metoxy-1,4-benzoquinol methylase
MNIMQARTGGMDSRWPLDGLERVESCPVCGNGSRELLYDDLRDRIFFCAPGKWTVYRCSRCSSVYLDPRPTPETIQLAYRRYYTHSTDGEMPFEQLSRLRRLRRALANGYRNHRFGLSEKPANPIGVIAAWLLPSQRAIIDAEMRHLPAPHAGARLLDVGCGNGRFLARARAAGWQVLGLDVDARAVEVTRSRGIEARIGDVEGLSELRDHFDGITVRHVIEHVHDPTGLLSACHHLLKPGGWIWVETPNLASRGHELFGSAWRDLDPPRHLVLFTRKSLWQTLKGVGFERLEDQRHRPLCKEIFAASLAIARGDDPTQACAMSPAVSRLACEAERTERRDPNAREFVTVRAHRES